MSNAPITTKEQLHEYLHAAIQLEHATLPPYLVALYSIYPGTNVDAFQVIRCVAVEEMLHLTLAANMLNATGGTPNLTRPGFVPAYPAYLPDGETDFQVSCGKFSKKTVETFLKIERPAIPEEKHLKDVHPKQSKLGVVERKASSQTIIPTMTADKSEYHFYSIGEFYAAIAQGIEHLCDEMGEDKVFVQDEEAKNRQITPEYYYSGGGEIIPVYDLLSAKAACRLISEQGEGHDGAIFDYEGEISHYYRFEQLILGNYYLEGDQPGQPSGGPLDIDWEAVYPIKTDIKLADLPPVTEVHQAVRAFNETYFSFLGRLTHALNGKPDLFIPAIGDMFHIKNRMYEIMRNPIPGTDGVHAAPTFEVDEFAKKEGN